MNLEHVDLGLPSGTLWAKCNLGAEKESDFGKFFQWGDTQGYSGVDEHQFSWEDYRWGTIDNLTKYNNTDGLTTLQDEDDAVFVATGGKMRMPTKEQLQELIDHTDHEWTAIDGVNGMKFTNKSDVTKHIFIPTAGMCVGGHHLNVNAWGILWSSSIFNLYGLDDDHHCAQTFYFGESKMYIVHSLRCAAYSLRGVSNTQKK